MLAIFPTVPCCSGWFFYSQSPFWETQITTWALSLLSSGLSFILGSSSTLFSDLSTWLGISLPDLPYLMHREFSFILKVPLVHRSSPVFGISTLITLTCHLTIITRVEEATIFTQTEMFPLLPHLPALSPWYILISMSLWPLWCLQSWEALWCLSFRPFLASQTFLPCWATVLMSSAFFSVTIWGLSDPTHWIAHNINSFIHSSIHKVLIKQLAFI